MLLDRCCLIGARFFLYGWFPVIQWGFLDFVSMFLMFRSISFGLSDELVLPTKLSILSFVSGFLGGCFYGYFLGAVLVWNYPQNLWTYPPPSPTSLFSPLCLNLTSTYLYSFLFPLSGLLGTDISRFISSFHCGGIRLWRAKLIRWWLNSGFLANRSGPDDVHDLVICPQWKLIRSSSCENALPVFRFVCRSCLVSFRFSRRDLEKEVGWPFCWRRRQGFNVSMSANCSIVQLRVRYV